MPEEINFVNHGVLLGHRPTDFAGGTLPYVIKRPDGNWRENTPTPETQWGSPGGDKMNCVTQSGHNVLETIFDFDIKTGVMPKIHQDWLRSKGYFDANEKINCSEKFSAILNGTTKDGNWIYIVWDHIRKLSGVIPEAMLPSDSSEAWDVYYNRQQITQAMIDLGIEFTKWFEVKYEYTAFDPDNLKKELKAGPLQVIIPGHAIEELSNEDQVDNIFDSYPPYFKQLPHQNLVSAYKIIINYITKMIEFVHLAGTAEYGFMETTPFTKILHRAVNEDHIKVLAAVFNQTGILTPEGKVDFTKAKEINV